ncbi:MAG: asparagine synthase (glutamine-hydrolyzing), partial [Bacteroidota bacterium]
MCGIISIIDQEDRPVPESELQQALALVQHRGPDGQGQYFGPNFALGHQRLAIIDLSEQGRQPMTYQGMVVTYNGELYNYIELREELRQKGYTFRTESDTEVLLAAYHHWGPECVQHFNGMWAFVLYDPHNNRIFCSRDRYGIKPLYYARIGQRFCLASEIKQLRAIAGWTAQLNPLRAYEFLVKGYHDHTDQTLFKGVKQLRGGQNILYDLDCHCHSIQTYYQPNATAPLLSTSFAAQCEQFHGLLLDAVRLRLRADVKVGTALSGGLDSSSIATLMHRLLQAQNAQEQQEAVSSCFDDPRFDEQEYIDTLVQQKAIRSHKVFPDFDQLREELDQLQWQQDEPVASASVYAQYCVFRMSKAKGLTVMLDGQGADEILGGYEKFYTLYFKTLLRQAPWQLPVALFRFATLHNPAKLLRLARNKYSATKVQARWLQPKFLPPQERHFSRSS